MAVGLLHRIPGFQEKYEATKIWALRERSGEISGFFFL
jgi:hypothetical protein